MITLKPVGGLGNRMRALSSAIALQRERGDELSIIWDQSHVLNCPFEWLFEKPADVHVNNIPYNTFRRVRRIIDKKINHMWFKRLMYDRVLVNYDLGYKKKLDSDLLDASKMKHIYIETYKLFYDHDSLHHFKFSHKALSRAERLSDQFSVKTIGVHVRRGDHPTTRKMSPDQAFIAQMKQEIEWDPKVSFFLATDSVDTENSFKKAFGNRILLYENKMNTRVKEEGIVDALVDMICLSRTSKVIGSHNSTFSRVSAQISQIPLEVVHVE